MFSRSKMGRHVKTVPVVLFLAFSLASLVESAPSLPEVEVLHQKEENIVREPSEHEAETSRRGTVCTAARVHAKIM